METNLPPFNNDNILKVIEAYDTSIVEINNNIKTLKAYPNILKEEKFKKYYLLFDKCLYNCLIQNDLVIGLKYLDVSNVLKNLIEANYFARVVVLNSYEALNNLDKLIGKEIKSFCEMNDRQESFERIKAIGKKINALKKSCFTYLRNVRNTVIGHKDSDALKQTKTMLEIDNREIYIIGSKVNNLSLELINEYMKLMEE